MKIEWLVVNATPAVSPDGEEGDVLGMILDVFWPIHHFLKTEWLVADVTPVESPSRVEHVNLGGDFGRFGQLKICRVIGYRCNS